jgi:isopenicillin-N N-acyltransferase like protein
MRRCCSFLICLLLGLLLGCQGVKYTGPGSPNALFADSLDSIVNVVEPPAGAAGETFTAQFKIVEAEGAPGNLAGHEIDLAVQAPDRLRVVVPVENMEFQVGRNGQQLWIYAPEKHFCLLGRPGIARFAAEPDSRDTSKMDPLRLPVTRGQIDELSQMLDVERLPDTLVGTNLCYQLVASRRPTAFQTRHLPAGRLELWVRQSDKLPLRINYSNDHGVSVTVEAQQLDFQPAWPAARWNFSPAAGDRTQTVALSQLTEFFSTGWSLLNQKIPALGPATGERRILATEGQGRLEDYDGTKVLFVKGSPEEMGRQQGVLLKKEIAMNVRQILYGVGIASSLAQGTWLFGEMERAQQRLQPYMDEKYLREMDAMAAAAGQSKEEVRMANLFPELFHCSGFAIYGDATVGGHLYHGRILDYFRGLGLEQNAVVMVFQPDHGNAWVNISYAGFIGSVTAMNEKGVAIGEIGGRGEGQWDGKPMAQLVREAMEKADTIDEAIDIFRRGPRTCEYYYVISDGKTRRAVAIHATPAVFEMAWAGERHPLIPDPIKDAVLVSGGDRLTELHRRIEAGYGKFDAESARGLMTPPVCMNSNIHSVLFEPDTLDFWVANADSQNVASLTRYTHYNLAELLGGKPAPLAVNRQ